MSDNNPQAFPLGAAREGMTLRDYFAAKAMQGMVAGHGHITDKVGMAEAAYEIAAAMLKARNE